MNRRHALIPIALILLCGGASTAPGGVAIDERSLLDTLEARAGLITGRLKLAHDPFLADCEAALADPELSASGRASVALLASKVFRAWIDLRGAPELTPMISRLGSLHPRMPDPGPGATLGPGDDLALAVAEIAEPEYLTEETRPVILGILGSVPSLKAMEEKRRLEKAEAVDEAVTAAEAEALAQKGDWLGALAALPGMDDAGAVWGRIRKRLLEREGYVLVELDRDEPREGEFPALDSMERTLGDPLPRVDPASPPRVVWMDASAPCPPAPGGQRFELAVPPGTVLDIEMPLVGGTSSTFRVTVGTEPVRLRLPHRFPPGMVLLPQARPPFFVDRVEYYGIRFEGMAPGRVPGMDGLLDSGPKRPLMLVRQPLPPELAAEKAVRRVAEAEGKQMMTEDDWWALVELWAGGKVTRAWNFGPAAKTPEPLGSGTGPLGIDHVVGNVWEYLEGGRLAGGGTSDMPFDLAWDNDLVLTKTYPWSEPAIVNVGFRLVVRLGRESR